MEGLLSRPLGGGEFACGLGCSARQEVGDVSHSPPLKGYGCNLKA